MTTKLGICRHLKDKVLMTDKIMKVLKEKSREYKGKEYHRYRINIPEEIIKKAEIKEGDNLEATATNGEIKLRKK